MKNLPQGYEIRFFRWRPKEEGGRRFTEKVGLGSDGALWVDPRVLGVEPEVMRDLGDYPGPLVAFDLVELRVFVNAQAVASTIECPERRRRKMEIIDDIVDELHPTNFR